MRLRVGIAHAADAVSTSAAGTREAADRIADAIEAAVRMLGVALGMALVIAAVAVLSD